MTSRAGNQWETGPDQIAALLPRLQQERRAKVQSSDRGHKAQASQASSTRLKMMFRLQLPVLEVQVALAAWRQQLPVLEVQVAPAAWRQQLRVLLEVRVALAAGHQQLPVLEGQVPRAAGHQQLPVPAHVVLAAGHQKLPVLEV